MTTGAFKTNSNETEMHPVRTFDTHEMKPLCNFVYLSHLIMDNTGIRKIKIIGIKDQAPRS